MTTDGFRKIGLIGLLLAITLTGGSTFAQNANTGEIKGTVTDNSGAVVPGVKVTITNLQTGISTVTTSNSAGIYDAPSVPTGAYKITFAKDGFRDFVRQGLTLQVQTIAVDASLQVGSATEEIIVTSEAPLVETETSDQHVDLNAEAVHAAPIVGTDWRAEMTQLIPGVNAGGGTGEAAGQQIGVNGTQSYNVNFLSDGSAATAPRNYNSSNYYMPLDAIGEISVNSGNASAQYGNGLTSINVITKSGTNQWHGSAYEFIQNTAFNARGFFNQTISEVSRSELDEIAEHPGRAVTLTLYGISEGMQALQMCGGEKPAGLLTSRGEVWFPSSRGPVRININQPKPSEGAPVVVDQVVADGAQIPAGRGIALTPDTVKLELHYGAVLLRSQERVRFRYMLEGFDKNWNESTAERVATYTNLPAGRYRFRVAAFEMNNPEAIAETSLNLTQEPHFYRTIWFICLCMVAVAAMVWSVHRFRVGQLRVRFRAVLDERNRLAREMHDTLIQGCVSVSALLEAHSGLGHVEADAKQDLMNCARTQLRTTINEAREAVWDLRQTTDPAASLEPSLRKMTEEVSHEFGVPVDYQISGKPFDFHQETKHELLMIVREAIYNAVRHGRPGHILLDIEFEMNQCRVRVVDDGSGFDPEQIASRPAGHYGLICMRERVQRIGGRFALSSRSGGGTEITVQVPKRPVSSNVVRVGL